MPTTNNTTTVKYNPASNLPYEVHEGGHLVTRFGSREMAEAFAEGERDRPVTVQLAESWGHRDRELGACRDTSFTDDPAMQAIYDAAYEATS